MSLSKAQIIEDTVAYYSKDPKGRRSFINDMPDYEGCAYLSPNGNRCAFGRYMVDEVVEEIQNEYHSIWSIYYDFNKTETDKDGILGWPLVEEARGHSLQFWIEVQNLHDIDEYWNNEGLTGQGKKRLERLREKWV